jgi:beta-glucosidase-like glycosyl hydrolase
MFEEGLASVMVAHLNVPSLSPNQIILLLFLIMLSQILQRNWAFKVLFFTDALNMKAVSKFSTPGQIDLRAFLARNDVLLFRKMCL